MRQRSSYDAIVTDWIPYAARGLAENWASLLKTWTYERRAGGSGFGLDELKPILAILDRFATLVEDRLSKTLRNSLIGTVEALCKAAVDDMHKRCVSELSGASFFFV